MDPLTIGYWGCAAFVSLICLRAPIAYAMAIVGTLGLFSVYDLSAVFKFIPFELYSQTSSFTLAALPLFLLMGYLAFHADLARDSYEAAKAWFGRVPGGLAVGTVYGCAIFGACSGSSLATCAVFSKISVPEMIRSGYSRKLSLGSSRRAADDVLIRRLGLRGDDHPIGNRRSPASRQPAIAGMLVESRSQAPPTSWRACGGGEAAGGA
jgi:TRAP-type mannitol/chloroaromatic compound transport system permease large subunit